MNRHKHWITGLTLLVLFGCLSQPISALNAQNQITDIQNQVWSLNGGQIAIGGYVISPYSNVQKPVLIVKNTADMSTVIDLTNSPDLQKQAITALTWGLGVLASGSADGTVAIWSMNNPQRKDGELLAKFGNLGASISSIVWSPNNSLIAVLARNKQVSIWNASINAFFRLDTIATSEDGELDWDYTESIPLDYPGWTYSARLMLWNNEGFTEYKVSAKRTFEGVSEHKLLPLKLGTISLRRRVGLSNTYILANASNKNIYFYDADTYKVTRTLVLANSPIALTWGGEANLAYEDNNNIIHVVNSITGFELAHYPAEKSSVKDIYWSSDGSSLIRLTSDYLLQTIVMPDHVVVFSYAWEPRPNSNLIAICGYTTTSDFKHITPILTLRNDVDMSVNLDLGTDPFLAGQQIIAMSWSPDGKYLASAQGKTIAVWAINDSQYQRGQRIATLNESPTSNALIGTIEWSPDSKWIVAVLDYNQIDIWSATNNDYHLSDTLPYSEPIRLTWSPDSAWLGLSHAYGVNVLKITNTGKFEPHSNYSFPPQEYAVYGVAWKPNNKQIALSSSTTNDIKIYDSASQTVVHTIKLPTPPARVVWKPDGTQLAYIGMDNTIHVINPETDVELGHYLSGEHYGYSVVWKPDGSKLAYLNGENKPYPLLIPAPSATNTLPSSTSTPP